VRRKSVPILHYRGRKSPAELNALAKLCKGAHDTPTTRYAVNRLAEELFAVVHKHARGDGGLMVEGWGGLVTALARWDGRGNFFGYASTMIGYAVKEGRRRRSADGHKKVTRAMRWYFDNYTELKEKHGDDDFEIAKEIVAATGCSMDKALATAEKVPGGWSDILNRPTVPLTYDGEGEVKQRIATTPTAHDEVEQKILSWIAEWRSAR
jgi:hypothetical protein